MFNNLGRIAIFWAALIPALATAEPITLKLAYYSSDRSHLYKSGIAPFVDAVNKAGKGLVRIEVYFSNKLGGGVKQSQLLLNGLADIAYVVTSYERASFPDGQVIELPGLYRDGREATLVFNRLLETGMMRGFSDFFVVGAFASQPETIHSRVPINSLKDLSGKYIRVINETESAVMRKLEANPIFVPLTRTANALASGRVDGAYVPPVPMVQFGIGRVTSHHYFLRTSSVPLTLLMRWKRFNRLPTKAQKIIRDYGGIWLARQSIRIDQRETDAVIKMLQGDVRRKVVFPTATELKKVEPIFEAVIDEYIGGDPHRAELVAAARREIAKLRQSN